MLFFLYFCTKSHLCMGHAGLIQNNFRLRYLPCSLVSASWLLTASRLSARALTVDAFFGQALQTASGLSQPDR